MMHRAGRELRFQRSVEQADATLELVNVLSVEALDDDLALNSRAVDSIINARPIDTVDSLSRLYYVGGSALRTLKAAAIDLNKDD